MHQKELARQVWEKAGFYRTNNARLRAFLKHFDAAPAECWPDIVNEVRTKYPELKAQLVAPLWSSGDTLLRSNLLRRADPTQPDELALLQKLAANLRPERNPVELRIATTIASPEVLARLAKLPGLTPELTRSLTLRREALLAHRAAEEQEHAASGDAAPVAPAVPPRPRRKASKTKHGAARRGG